MAAYERSNGSEEWYTPRWIFEALNVRFDLDPCAAIGAAAIPWCRVDYTSRDGLSRPWYGSVWLNPPFGARRNAIRPWLQKFIEHGNGIAIVPNRTATPWFQEWAKGCDALLFLAGKVRFVKPDGTEGPSPGFGNVLGACGEDMRRALLDSELNGLRVLPGDFESDGLRDTA